MGTWQQLGGFFDHCSWKHVWGRCIWCGHCPPLRDLSGPAPHHLSFSHWTGGEGVARGEAGGDG